MPKLPPPLLQRLLTEAFAALNSGRTAEAEAAAKNILRQHSREPNALYLLGVLSHQAEDLKTAASFFEKSYKADSQNVAAIAGLGIVRLDQNRTGEAERLFSSALKQQPDDPALLNNLGLALKRQTRLEEAKKAFERAVRRDPTFVSAQINLGDALKATGQHDLVIEHYRNALKFSPQHAELTQNYGVALIDGSQLDEGANILKDLVARDPSATRAANILGAAQINLGALDEAEATFQKILEGNPGDIDTLLDLSELLSAREEPKKSQSEAILEKALSTYEKWARDKNAIGTMPFFRLAKGYDRLNRYNEAFPLYGKAHREAVRIGERGVRRYSPSAQHAEFDRLISVFLDNPPTCQGDPSYKPVFIVGLPRSGTTLLERILSAHDAIVGVGESMALPGALQPYLVKYGDLSATLSAMDEDDFKQISDTYLDEISKAAPEAQFVVDKLPSNFVNTGLIRTIFPNATIIHSRRSLLDTCVSIYAQAFTEDLGFNRDLGDIGHYCKEYVRLMRFWHDVDPTILCADYEAVVENAQSALTPLLSKMGLSWQTRMESFHQQKGTVMTASRLQVRQPIYRGSLEKWRKYEAHLGPLKMH